MTFATLYHAASRRVRVNFWLTVGLFIAAATTSVLARTTDGTTSNELVTPSTVISLAAAFISAGIVLGEFRSLQKELETRARKEVVDEQFRALQIALDALKAQVAEGNGRWTAFNNMVQSWSSGQEGKVNAINIAVTRLAALLERREHGGTQE